ncbi:hypothetical protein [Belnapia rosea]|uniref:hypothetical protein n=1 Tax=Belnapia rosea TaxID=938405 RepID=UPI000882AD1F|nr:hypothetical protein [Belnapia rosea]SDB71513.1 hypothetical protein SAMN02927895_04117 [Belnapia rosea]
MLRLSNAIANRVALATSTATAALLAGFPVDALAQGADLFARGEQIGAGLGRAGSAIMGPLFLIVGAIVFLLSAWYLFGGANRNNQGRGLYGMAIVGFIAGSILAGIGGFATLGSQTFTGGAATASTQPFTFGR